MEISSSKAHEFDYLCKFSIIPPCVVSCHTNYPHKLIIVSASHKTFHENDESHTTTATLTAVPSAWMVESSPIKNMPFAILRPHFNRPKPNGFGSMGHQIRRGVARFQRHTSTTMSTKHALHHTGLDNEQPKMHSNSLDTNLSKHPWHKVC